MLKKRRKLHSPLLQRKRSWRCLHLLSFPTSKRRLTIFSDGNKQNFTALANNLAVVYMAMGKFEHAKKILGEQLKKHPENKALKYNYNEVLKNIIKE